MSFDLASRLAERRAAHLFRQRPLLQSPQGPLVKVDGRELLAFCSNDYLGFAAESPPPTALPRGAGASRLISGNHPAHPALEARLASWLGAEAALLFGSGYQANVGLISTIAGPGDLILSDALVHASLIDGCRLSRARVEVFPHNDLARIDALLSQHRSGHRRCFLLTESLFSMDGDRAPLADLVALADRFAVGLIVDEAHAFGALGPGGAGLSPPGVFARVGTFGKALGRYGAFVAGPRALIELLLSKARSFVFSTALPPAISSEVDGVLDQVIGAAGEERRAALATNVARVDAALAQLELPRSGSHIVPLRVRSGEPGDAMRLCDRLLDRGLFVQGIRPPTVPSGSARLRLSLSAAHLPGHLDRLLAALTDLRPELR